MISIDKIAYNDYIHYSFSNNKSLEEFIQLKSDTFIKTYYKDARKILIKMYIKKSITKIINIKINKNEDDIAYDIFVEDYYDTDAYPASVAGIGVISKKEFIKYRYLVEKYYSIAFKKIRKEKLKKINGNR